MTIVSLISAVNQNIQSLIEGMHLETDAVLVNQCDRDETGEHNFCGNHVTWRCMPDRGVGLSRNTCIAMAEEGDILLFTDEDITYDKGYSKLIVEEFELHPEADCLIFNMRVCDARRTYWNENYARIRFYNYGKFPAYSIAIKRESLSKSGVTFPLEFGGGAKYINGEDSVFLHDLLKAGIKIYRTPVCIGQEAERESTWFKGFNDAYFISRGALYVRLYGIWDRFRAILFLVRNPYTFEEYGFWKAYALMKKGMKEMRNTK